MARIRGLDRSPAYIEDWFRSLQAEPLASVCVHPEQVGVFCTDMTIAFCQKGNLASRRVGALAIPIANLLRSAYSLGVRHFVLVQDAHSPQAEEFRAFPSHSVAGTEESKTVPELMELPFSGLFITIGKNSLHPAINTEFDRWLEEHMQVRTAIVVGNCTDFCIYNLAMYLRMRANALDLSEYEVVVPAKEVDTYDMPEHVAAATGSLPHSGRFFHEVFLYHMATNGIRVLQDLV